MLSNKFDIVKYLKEAGFEEIAQGKHFYRNDPKMKVKLIHPDPSFFCGFQTMAISDPDRKFAKRELEIPKNNVDADRVFLPLSSYRPERDASYNNTWETQVQIIDMVPVFYGNTEVKKNIAMAMSGANMPTEATLKHSLNHMIDGIIPGDWVHVVLKVDGGILRGRTINTLEIISIHKV